MWYLLVTHTSKGLFRVGCFLGRGFFEQDIPPGNIYAWLAAGEAVTGLLIEISFVATFTQLRIELEFGSSALSMKQYAC